jgi:hypothetical protein
LQLSHTWQSFESFNRGLLLAAGNKLLHPALEITPFQQDPAVAAATPDPNVSAQSHNLPLIAAAGILHSANAPPSFGLLVS